MPAHQTFENRRMEDNKSRRRRSGSERGKKMFSIVECFFAAIYAPKKFITWYTPCSVFFHLSFNGNCLCKNEEMKWLVTSQQRRFRKYLCHKSPKGKAVLQLIRNFMLSTCTLGMPPPHIKTSHKSKVVPARNAEAKLKFH